uniref:Uncharacterized protein n=1 Tax=Anguilla anguilla TaxID=7936 RepID=A0A0E9WB51_ANGAN
MLRATQDGKYFPSQILLFVRQRNQTICLPVSTRCLENDLSAPLICRFHVLQHLALDCSKIAQLLSGQSF